MTAIRLKRKLTADPFPRVLKLAKISENGAKGAGYGAWWPALAERVPDFGDARDDARVDAYRRYFGLDFAGVEARFGALRIAGYALACHHFRRPSARGTCFVLHGYLDHSGLFARLAGHCLASGFDVVAWDLPGHGLSSGTRATIDDFASYRRCWRGLVERLETEVTRPWLAVGQSTGAAILLDDLRAGDGPDLAARNLLAPLVHAGGWRSMRIGLPLLRPFRSRLRRHFVRNTSDDEFLRFQREDDPLQSRHIPLDWVAAMLRWSAAYVRWHGADVPLRIVQGDADRTVAWRDNLPLLERQFANAQLVMISGAGHQLANEGDEVRTRVFAALDLLDG